jgi:predicted dehydrogenase
MFYINRRNFLKSAIASVAFAHYGALGHDLVNPSKPYRVGLIGCGWYGKSDLMRLLQVVPCQVLALCDVDSNMLNEAASWVQSRNILNPKPQLYTDYRDLLAKHELDIVLIGTPDHWHALQGIAAMQAGANVYLQKPTSLDVLEGEALLKVAQDTKKVVQVGTQRRSTPHFVDLKNEIIDSGKLGAIHHVEMYCYYHMRNKDVLPEVAIPSTFNYDLWTGPAPMRPFTGLPHRGRWRAFTDYSNGIMGDMCVHMLDTARWFLDLGWPTQIHSVGGIYSDKKAQATITDTQTAIFEYPELQCQWTHRSWGATPNPEYPWAISLYGEKGVLTASTMKAEFKAFDRPSRKQETQNWFPKYEKEKFPEDLTEPNIELHAASATRAHMLDLVASIEKVDKPTASTITDGHISTASCILANISAKTGKKLSYNPLTHTVTNDTEATALLKKEYRAPWQHPYDVYFSK